MKIYNEYEKNYNGLSAQEKSLVDDLLEQCLYDGHVDVCGECAKNLFALPDNVDFSKETVHISEDYFIDSNTCAELICEVGDCTHVADYTINLVDED